MTRHARYATRVAAAVAAVLAVPGMSHAQPSPRDVPPHTHIAFHPLVGGFVPLAAARNALGDGFLAGAQLGLGLPLRFGVRAAAVATAFGARAQQSVPTPDRRSGVAAYGYDIGLEFGGRLSRLGTDEHAPTFLPFLGLGGGGRTYNPDARGVPSRSGGAGYISLGGEWAGGGSSRTALRFEGRNYWSRLDPRGVVNAWRTDLVLDAGLAYHFR